VTSGAGESSKSMNPEVKLDVSANNKFVNERISRKGIQINFFILLTDFAKNIV